MYGYSPFSFNAPPLASLQQPMQMQNFAPSFGYSPFQMPQYSPPGGGGGFGAGPSMTPPQTSGGFTGPTFGGPTFNGPQGGPAMNPNAPQLSETRDEWGRRTPTANLETSPLGPGFDVGQRPGGMYGGLNPWAASYDSQAMMGASPWTGYFNGIAQNFNPLQASRYPGGGGYWTPDSLPQGSSYDRLFRAGGYHRGGTGDASSSGGNPTGLNRESVPGILDNLRGGI